MLKGKKILIGVSGSIAAYKIPLLIRLLIKEGAEVNVISTEAAKDFVTPLTMSTLSGNPVYSDFFNKEDGTWNSHIEFGHWADVYVIAPVSANTMGKMANGIADNLLVATYLAAKCPVVFAPAMDVDMYNHASTSKNIKQLQSYGNILLEPESGELASGLCGAGRMQEPENILSFLQDFFKKKKALSGKRVLISAGPTYEPIDPVRFIGNYSSGKMGYAIAKVFADNGAIVELVSGPVDIELNETSINLHKVHTANEMFEVCSSLFRKANITIMAAAVADYTPAHAAKTKIKKKVNELNLELKPTKDILKHLGTLKQDSQILIGFALETNNEIENAILKIENKNLDLIVLNSLQDKGAGFGHTTNKVSFIDKENKIEEFDLKSKNEVAQDLLNKTIFLIKNTNKA